MSTVVVAIDVPDDFSCARWIVEHGLIEPVIARVVVAGDPPVGRAGAVVCVIGNPVAVKVGQHAHTVDDERIRLVREAKASRVGCVQVAGVRKVLADRAVGAAGRTLRRRVDDRVLAVDRGRAFTASSKGKQSGAERRKSGGLERGYHCEIAHIRGKQQYSILLRCVRATSRRHLRNWGAHPFGAMRIRSGCCRGSNLHRIRLLGRTPPGRRPKDRGTENP